MGLRIGDDHLKGTFARQWTLGILGEIIRIIGQEQFEDKPFTVRTINTVEQQKMFVQKLLKISPRPEEPIPEWSIFADTDMTPDTQVEEPSTTTGQKPRPQKRPPNQIRVPRSENILSKQSVRLSRPLGQSQRYSVGVKEIDADKFTNAVSILFRVFLELSVERYISKHKLALPPEAKLRPKVQAAMQDMKAKKLMTDFKAVSVAVGTPDSIVSISTLHSYVHHPTFHPSPKELKIAWDRLQPFIGTLWIA